jgi:hypothetical protein
MKENRLIISLSRPAEEVFNFVLNPSNTPKWIESLLHEESNESPARLGTIYRNKSKTGTWGTYIISEFDPPKSFTMTSEDGNYHVRYTLKSLDVHTTEFEYFEWVDQGELPEPFSQSTLDKLKMEIEK